MADLRPDAVTSYLEDNPDFLERHVINHVSRETLERWMLKKAQQKPQLKNGETKSASLTGETGRRRSLTRWKLSAHADKRRLLMEMTREVHQYESQLQVLADLALCISTAVGADGHQLHLVDKTTHEVYRCEDPDNHSPHTDPTCRPLGAGTSLAAYVAHTKDVVRVCPVSGDARFPEGVMGETTKAHSAIAQPVIQANSDVIGVLILHRTEENPPFTEEDEELCLVYLTLASLVSSQSKMYHNMTKQRKLNEFLLAVTKSIFQDIVSMDTVIMKIMNFAKSLVSADRTALFLVDNRTKELYARVFDMGDESEDSQPPSPQSQKEIRFPMDKGVAGHVASTGEILNIQDAYADDRFNREVDMQTGYHTKTILCMPIYIRGNIIGVVQMVNKLHGVFNKSDEESFETFAIYCGLALHHAKLYDKIRRSEQKYKVALDVLSYHSQTSDTELDAYLRKDVPERIPSLTDYRFSPWAVDNDTKPIHVIYMFKDLFNMTRGNSDEPRFDLENLYRFTLTVRKNYRNVPYHNWAHAFSVAHAMYTVIKTSQNVFTPLETVALFVACLCHDVDHRGYTNQFMVKSASPLAAIYSTSTMEHHHFNHTITILQHEGHNIFKHLTSEEYKQVLGDIKHCILATDLALFFGNRARLKEIKDKEEFSWEHKDHRSMLMAACMTASDLCSMYKPWDLQVQLVHVIMEEFWQQGDEEKAAGEMPPAMMDRDRQHELPSLEVGFLVGICLPCYELLADILPQTKPMVEGAKSNLQKWRELADRQKEREEQNNAE